MNCVDTEHYIQLFVDDELTGPKLREFLKIESSIYADLRL